MPGGTWYWLFMIAGLSSASVASTGALHHSEAVDRALALFREARRRRPPGIGAGAFLGGALLACALAVLANYEAVVPVIVHLRLVPEPAIPALPPIVVVGAMLGTGWGMAKGLGLLRWIAYVAGVVGSLALVWASLVGAPIARLIGRSRHHWLVARTLALILRLAAWSRMRAHEAVTSLVWVWNHAAPPIRYVVTLLAAGLGSLRRGLRVLSRLGASVLGWVSRPVWVAALTCFRAMHWTGHLAWQWLLRPVVAGIATVAGLVGDGADIVASMVAMLGRRFEKLVVTIWAAAARPLLLLIAGLSALATGLRHMLTVVVRVAVSWLGSLLVGAARILNAGRSACRLIGQGLIGGVAALLQLTLTLVGTLMLGLCEAIVAVLDGGWRLGSWIVRPVGWPLVRAWRWLVEPVAMPTWTSSGPVARILVLPVMIFHGLLFTVLAAIVIASGAILFIPLFLLGRSLWRMVGPRVAPIVMQLLAACIALVAGIRWAAVRGWCWSVAAPPRIWMIATWPVQHPGELPPINWLDFRRRYMLMEHRPNWLWAAGGVLLLLIAFRFLPTTGLGAQSSASGAAAAAPPGSIAISMVSGGNKEEWLHASVDAFNAASRSDGTLQHQGKPIYVEIIQETVDGRKQDYRSGTMIADTLAQKIKPTILSPGEESWTLKFQKDWQGLHGRSVARDVGPTLVRSPLVVATWQSRARALGCWPSPEPECTWARLRAVASSPEGWGLMGHPEWGKLKFGYSYPGEANSGTLTAIAMCMAGAGKSAGLTVADVAETTGCGEFLAGVERAKVHSGVRSDWLFEQMTANGPEYLDAIVTYEFEVIGMNRTQGRNLREPLVAVYPQDGTVLVGHPFTILEGVPWVSDEQAAAARVLEKYLLSPSVQREVLAMGLRPADQSVPLGSPIEPSLGANPQARVAALEVPESTVIDQIVEVWHRVKKHAVLALVFDKSGSMSGAKIGAAAKGAQEFVRSMDRDDRLIWVPFDTQAYSPSEGSREDLVDRIAATPAGGETSLYDAISQAYDYVQNVRQEYGETRRYGIVVLSDGRDNRSRTTLASLESRLKPGESDPFGIQIHTIAIGDDADEPVLKKIANAAHGRFWKGQTVGDTVVVYKSIATYY
jgi:Ca-activated chloride channel homolog